MTFTSQKPFPKLTRVRGLVLKIKTWEWGLVWGGSQWYETKRLCYWKIDACPRLLKMQCGLVKYCLEERGTQLSDIGKGKGRVYLIQWTENSPQEFLFFALSRATLLLASFSHPNFGTISQTHEK